MTRKTEQVRRIKRPIDGVLLFDKPLELSSNTAMQKVRWLFRAEKAGHTGTLDPLATGLLPICFGEATKFTHALLDADKRYRATIRLGQRTTTGDAEGEIVEERPVTADEAQVRQVLIRFTGEISQLPPMHSALKHQGKPLYEYIRKGEVIEREPRQVFIRELHLERCAATELDIDVLCSKGTYIRTLAEDIGEALGCGGHLIALRRTGIGDFNLDAAHTLPDLEALDEAERDALLLPVDSLIQDFPALTLDDVQAGRLAQGQRLGWRDGHPDGKRRLYSDGQFIGLGELVTGRLSPSRLLSGIARAASAPKSA
ncbi:MAG: tRNA pseudouridine(55) synthase TruB [Gammaproteobacteria bacterium]|nr:tRNA pseudouridine(55) synthase TruB [Gammaproteobacteria bacterium]MDD2929365.1 tRNA pseudouridine(55) synthase TruB [Sideroxydans sp.]